MRQSIVISIFIGALLVTAVFGASFWYFHSLFPGADQAPLTNTPSTNVNSAVIATEPAKPKPQPSATQKNINSTGEIPEQSPDKNPVRVIAVGDIMLGRYVETLMKQRGLDYPFTLTSADIRGADIAFGNLEGPIPLQHAQTPDNSLSFSFPQTTPGALPAAGFDIVSLANNHTYDRGAAGFTETQVALEKAGLLAVGNPVQAGPEYVREMVVRDQRIVWVAFNMTSRAFNEEVAFATVRAARNGVDDVVLVSVHWGNEYQLQSAGFQQAAAHGFIDAGADAVIGHHPHVVQEVEVYAGRPIFYSLGNFIFDQYFSEDVQQGLVVEMEIFPERVDYSLRPAQSDLSQPQFMNAADSATWLTELAQRGDDAIAQDIAQGSLSFLR
ncbi:MAG: hypothetical protein A3F54_03200 [Candidatus Kerfeldbacteria bacterium RIFCSPHIGHO2_12_FULL_48_17]|uniref:Capsule synthesis protein CapA domain-containing protein n=1 Tax=Candidatus Kerfeldbacteria bacterium RIFCSPHIGHO2_12_FULL_48_17 TaxID=1798542 RepID=A0A1G2B831_9BACT|nr:MAG: hypothetical protein A3F54_03200 [Candidatus Kerfeldbacteria bacterium RIFCSPHIGHO2_12_FULL_48_17]